MLTTIFAVAIVILFLLEIFAVGFFRTGINPFNTQNTIEPTVTKEQGTAQFQATLRYYESYLVAKDLTEEQRTRITSQDSVLAVTNSQQGYIIELKSKEAVPLVYSFLQTINVTAHGVAVFGAPPDIEVTLPNKTVLQTNSNDRYILRQEIEPVIEPGTRVNATMNAVVEGILITGYGPLQILSSTVSLTVPAHITKIKSITSRFSIPWENRTQIDHDQLVKIYSNESVIFDRKDVIVFTPSLTLDQLKEKKNLSYITFISETSASVNKSYVDKNTIIADFEGFNITFPDSQLRIVTNTSVALSYLSDVYFVYELTPDSIHTTLPVLLTSPKQYALNESLSIHLTVEMLGNTIQKIISVEQSHPDLYQSITTPS